MAEIKRNEFFWDINSIDMDNISHQLVRSAHSFSWSFFQVLVKNRLKEKSPRDLKSIEIGCGLGKFSILMGLWGIRPTLIDTNTSALDHAKRLFNSMGIECELVNTDALTLPERLQNSFDIAVSFGLAEHFIGEERKTCIGYHKELLCQGGFACIGVPNKFSPFYQEIRLFRKITRTWNIPEEFAFSYTELNRLAREVGFSSFYILGNATLFKDFIVYSRGLVSAVTDMLPKNIKDNLRRRKSKITEKLTGQTNIIEEIANSAKKNNCKQADKLRSSRLSAGLVLFGFK